MPYYLECLAGHQDVYFLSSLLFLIGSFENQVGKQFEFILEKSNLPVSK